MSHVPFYAIDGDTAREEYEQSVRESGGGGGTLIFDLHCVDPLCDCTDVYLAVVDMDDLRHGATPPGFAAVRKRMEEAWQEKRDHVRFILEPESGRVLPPKGLETKAPFVRAAADLEASLRDEDRARFALHNKAAKKWGQKNAWRYMDWTWVDSGEMVKWLRVFPTTEPMRVEDRGIPHLCLDSYCATMGCPCNQVLLRFLEMEEEARDPREACALRLDLSQDPPPIDEMLTGPRALGRRLVDGLFAAHPDAAARFRRRRAFMRKEFAALVKKQLRELPASEEAESPAKQGSTRRPKEPPAAAPAASTGWIRRNEPCPCGSGLKYKNCCGRDGLYAGWKGPA